METEVRETEDPVVRGLFVLRIKADNEVHTVRDNRWGRSGWEQSGDFLLRILILNKEAQTI